MPTKPKTERSSPRIKRVSVFCTPKEKAALLSAAAHADKPINQFVLDTLGIAEIDVTTRYVKASD